MLTLGIDESARGPCIGAMFLVGALFEEDKLLTLKELGVKDSKLLTHRKRVWLAEKIKNIAEKIKVIKVSPQEIDNAVEGKDGLNLNWLEAIKQAEIINELEPDRAIIDCPSPNIRSYTNFLRKYIRKEILDKIELIVAHKADFDYVECSSASIIAKVEREIEVKKIEKITGMPIGSGYVSNPICQKFLKENFDKFPEIFRKSWISWKNHDEARKQKKIVDFKTNEL